MKARRILWAALLATAGVPASAYAQNPALIAQAAGAPPVVGAAAATAPTTATQPSTLWSFLGISKQQKEECRRKCCETPCGQFIGKFLAPATMFTGGIIPPFCPLTPSAAELADEGVVGDAAKIKAEEAQAKARRAAARYLGTVDCIRFPSAKDGLIKALRTDTNECVRFEAALALANGCCCNNETMESLAIAAACSDRDGHPREQSDRVRAAAVTALQNCLACYVNPDPPKTPEPTGEPSRSGEPGSEPIGNGTGPIPVNPPPGTNGAAANGTSPIPVNPPSGANGGAANGTPAAKAPAVRPTGAAYYAKIAQVPRNLIVAEARRTVEKFNQHASAEAILARDCSIASALNRAFDDTGSTVVYNNGVALPRAEVVSQRPQSLWELVSRPPTSNNGTMRDVGPNLTVEPPTVAAISPATPVITNEPMPISPPKIETQVPANVVKTFPAPIAPAPNFDFKPSIVPAPKFDIQPPMNAVKPVPAPQFDVQPPMASAKPVVTPKFEPYAPVGMAKVVNKIDPPAKSANWGPANSNASGYGERTVFRPMTTAELASGSKAPVKAELPQPLPVAVTQTPLKSEVRETMKPIAPVVNPATALAQRALTVLTQNHPATVRESIADSLSLGDLNSSPELLTALVTTAKSGDADSTRKAAIRAMVRCNLNTPQVTTALESIADDKTSAVRVEAAIGLARLKVGAAK